MGIKKEKEKRQAIALRLQGKSYNEIRSLLNVRSKGTISSWLKNLKLPPSAKLKLRKNIEKAHVRGFLRFNIDRTLRIKKENKTALSHGKASIGSVTKRELMLIGVALYWGEGTKSLARSNWSLSFANSDAKMVRTYMRFLREVCCVSEDKIRAGIHLYDNIDNIQGKKYWAKITKLPVERFWIVRQVSRASKGVRNPRSLPFGTVVIRVNNRKLFHEVLGMIQGLVLATK